MGGRAPHDPKQAHRHSSDHCIAAARCALKHHSNKQGLTMTQAQIIAIIRKAELQAYRNGK
jgi:hypothetical protein